MRALLLAALLAAPDGGLGDLYAACPDAPLAERVDGGWLVSDARDARLACQKAKCEAVATVALAPAEPEPSSASFVAVVIGAALVLVGGGFALGWAAKPQP